MRRDVAVMEPRRQLREVVQVRKVASRRVELQPAKEGKAQMVAGTRTVNSIHASENTPLGEEVLEVGMRPLLTWLRTRIHRP